LGAIWFHAIDFANAMSEVVGHKSGLALSREDLIEHVQDEDSWVDLFRLPDYQMIRIRSEAVEALVAHLLYRVGNIETPDTISEVIKLYHRFKKDENTSERLLAVMNDFGPLLQEAVDRTPQDTKLVDPTDLLTTIVRKHG
jgi:restriction system protein